MINPFAVLAMTIGTVVQAPAPPAPSPKAEPVPFLARREVAEKLIGESGAEVSVAYRTLDGREEWMCEADRVFHAASTMKVPVMVELFRQEAEKSLRLSDEIDVRNDFKSVVDGSPYSLSLGDDSDATVYQNVGKTMTLEALNVQMITVSSNFATNLLIDRLGVENVRETVEAMGAHGHAGPARGRGSEGVRPGHHQRNHGSRTVPDPERHRPRARRSRRPRVSGWWRFSAAQKFNDGIPRGLPPGTRVAHKTGTITRVHHDAAIVYGDPPCVLVILTRGIEKEADSDALIARITKALLP